MEYLKRVGENIKYYRQQAELSQEELAKRVGYGGRSTVAKIENGERDIPNSKLKAIADTLNVTVSQLLDESRTSNNEFEDRLIYAFNSADDTTKRLVAYALKLGDYSKEKR